MLLPAYSHGSEVEALVRAGLEPRWYEGTPALEPDEDELERLLGPATRALHLTHYLGFPQDAPRWRRWCDERGLVLLEDAAQAWLAELPEGPVGSFGHLSIFCLYKSVGVPDGAALLVGGEPGAPRAEAPLGADVAARKAAVWLTGRSATAASLLARAPRGRGGDDTALGDERSPASRATAYLLPRLTGAEVAAARRANYEVLLEELGDQVAAPFGTLPAGAAPFCFPVETGDKAALLARLAGGGVSGLDLLVGAPPGPPGERVPRDPAATRAHGRPSCPSGSARKGWSRCCRRFGGPLDGVPSRASSATTSSARSGRNGRHSRSRPGTSSRPRTGPSSGGGTSVPGRSPSWGRSAARTARSPPCSRSTSGRSAPCGSPGSWATTPGLYQLGPVTTPLTGRPRRGAAAAARGGRLRRLRRRADRGLGRGLAPPARGAPAHGRGQPGAARLGGLDWDG